MRPTLRLARAYNAQDSHSVPHSQGSCDRRRQSGLNLSFLSTVYSFKLIIIVNEIGNSNPRTRGEHFPKDIPAREYNLVLSCNVNFMHLDKHCMNIQLYTWEHF